MCIIFIYTSHQHRQKDSQIAKLSEEVRDLEAELKTVKNQAAAVRRLERKAKEQERMEEEHNMQIYICIYIYIYIFVYIIYNIYIYIYNVI